MRHGYEAQAQTVTLSLVQYLSVFLSQVRSLKLLNNNTIEKDTAVEGSISIESISIYTTSQKF